MTSRADCYRAERVRRALKHFRPLLGPRAALLGEPLDLPPRDVLARVLPAGATGSRTVVGAPDAAPLLSGSLTGVLLAHALPAGDADGAERVLAEASRLVQPGGVVLLLERISLREGDEGGASRRGGDEVLRLLRAAGLTPGRRTSCHATPSWAADRAERLPRPLWGVAAVLEGLAQRVRLARPAAITGLIAGRKAGGLDVEYPDLRRMMGGMFVPPSWLERRRRDA